MIDGRAPLHTRHSKCLPADVVGLNIFQPIFRSTEERTEERGRGSSARDDCNNHLHIGFNIAYGGGGGE